MTEDNRGFRWEDNGFGNDIAARLRRQWSRHSGEPMRAGASGWWEQACPAAGASQPALLQNRFAAVDVTDRGLCVCPMALDGRHYLRVGFDCAGKAGKALSFPDAAATDVIARFEPGRFVLAGEFQGLALEMAACMPPDFPFLVVDFTIRGLGEPVAIEPWLLWMPGTCGRRDGLVWLEPASVPLADAALANNNSRTADPPRPERGAIAGVGMAVEGITLESGRSASCETGEVLLCDRPFPGREVHKLSLSPLSGVTAFTLILGFCRSAGEFEAEVSRWNGLEPDERARQRGYWDDIRAAFSIRCADAEIARQAAYSVHNSLFSRCAGEGGRTIFIHGRPDRGYGDCAKLHQSYQMHFAALAAGQEQGVRDELLCFAAAQRQNGDMAVQLRPGGGCHPYAGLYSNAHFILALHRYLCWTGDFDLLGERPADGADTVLGCARRAAEWLLENRSDGLVRPCGWLDAWPPRVAAQAQISICAEMAFGQLADILCHTGDGEGASLYRAAAARLGERILQVFYDEGNGLFAEHRFDTGRVEGGTRTDFWAHTQIWAALAGLAPDGRGLDACRADCLTAGGMAVIPESGMESAYVAESTDGLEDLSLWSTATWLLAAWPELTHLYALAQIRYGRPAEALAAVRGQLPCRVHGKNPHASPYYYAEKYLHPYDTPWLCTWSGDPTLLQAVTEGFAGVRAELGGLRFEPCVPAELCGGGPLAVSFCWRGKRIRLEITGAGRSVGREKLNGHRFRGAIRPGMLRESNVVEICIEN